MQPAGTLFYAWNWGNSNVRFMHLSKSGHWPLTTMYQSCYQLWYLTESLAQITDCILCVWHPTPNIQHDDITCHVLFVYNAWRCWLGGRKGNQPVKNWVVGCWRGYLGWGTDLHMSQQMPLPLTISCSSKSRLVLPSWFLPFCVMDLHISQKPEGLDRYQVADHK